jgi:hypothetical protein
MKEESMPRDSARVLQLSLFVHDTVAYLDAIIRYKTIRPVLKGERSFRPIFSALYIRPLLHQ